MLEAAGAHGTLLQEGGREAALPKGRQGADRVVSHDGPCVGEVDFKGSGLEGQRAGEGLAASASVQMTAEKRATKGATYGRQAE